MSISNIELAKGPFIPTVHSLTNYIVPDWFRDAKFGVYTHWGPVSAATAKLPAGESDDWYGRYMYCPGLHRSLPSNRIRARRTFELHRDTFGDQTEFGFKDIIPFFKAEKFDAAAWADLFEKSGAKFAGSVVIHHDNFAMWNSSLTRWNAMNMGPGRDIISELEQAIHARGMKFVAAMHHAMTWYYYEQAYVYDARDAQYADLYCEPHPPADPDLSKDWHQVEWTPPSTRFVKDWLEKCQELVDKHEVDLLWHDAALDKLPESVRLAMAAHFYNRSIERGQEPVLTYKGLDLPAGTAVLDFERHAADSILQEPWLTDTSVGHQFWFYDSGDKDMYSIAELVRMLVEIVCKNGCLLLNVGPHPDGSISKKQTDILLGIGKWLKVNGEAIYGSRPWKIHGEGPHLNGGGSDNSAQTFYTQEDIRFTQKDDMLYAFVLGVPERDITINSLGRESVLLKTSIHKVSLLGSEQPVTWTQRDNTLVIRIPERLPNEYTLVFQISLK